MDMVNRLLVLAELGQAEIVLAIVAVIVSVKVSHSAL